MKLLPYLTVAMMMFASINTTLYANELFQEDGIFPNHSAEYVRTLNRNASTEADGAFYNPAGLVLMDKGLYIMFSNQIFYKKRMHAMNYYYIDIYAPSFGIDEEGPTQNPHAYTNRPTGNTSSDNCYFMETTSPALPDLNIIYRDSYSNHEFALYYSMGVMQAAPRVVFPKSLAQVDFGMLATGELLAMAADPDSPFTEYTYESNIATRTEYFIGNTVGASYKILNFLSASVATRFIYGYGNQNIKVNNPRLIINDAAMDLGNWDIDVDYEGYGLGIIAGINVNPFNKLIIGLRYEYYFPMILKKNTQSFEVNPILEATGQLNIFKDGTPDPDFNSGSGYLAGNGKKEFKGTYPQSASIGIAYYIIDNLRCEIDSDVYLRKYVDLDGRENDYDIGYRIGGSLEYAITSPIVLSAGYSYYDPGIKKDKRNEIDPLLQSHSIGGGIKFILNDSLVLNIGGFYTIYKKEKVHQEIIIQQESLLPDTRVINYVSKELDEITFSIGMGLTYRFKTGTLSQDTESTDQPVLKLK